MSGDWDESKHPRGEHGQFGASGQATHGTHQKTGDHHTDKALQGNFRQAGRNLAAKGWTAKQVAALSSQRKLTSAQSMELSMGFEEGKRSGR